MTQTTERHYGVTPARELAAMTGRQMLEAIRDGRLPAPPIAQGMTFDLVDVGDGFAAFEGRTGEHLLNPAGTVHGGWVLTLIDSAAACAAHSTLPAGKAQTTIETKANFTRPVLAATGTVRCEARVVSRGRQIVTAEAHVTDPAGKVVAHGTSTLMVFDLPV